MARSEALKKAQENYYKNKRSKTQKTISITMTSEQAEADKKRIAAAGFTISQFWRAKVDELPEVPTSDKDE